MSCQELLSRISINPDICHGKPCIKGHRIWVSIVLDALASGTTTQELLRDYPGLTEADVLACVAYGAEATRQRERHHRKDLTPDLMGSLEGAASEVRSGTFVSEEDVVAELEDRRPATSQPVVRVSRPNRPVERVPLDGWVNENNPLPGAQYAKGYWDLVEFLRRLEFKFEANGLFAVGTHVVFTPPPEEELIVPVAYLDFGRTSVVLEHDFSDWPDQWRAGVKLDRPFQGPTLGLFDPRVGAGRDGDAIEELAFPAHSENWRGFSCRLHDDLDVASLVRLLLADPTRR